MTGDQIAGMSQARLQVGPDPDPAEIKKSQENQRLKDILLLQRELIDQLTDELAKKQKKIKSVVKDSHYKEKRYSKLIRGQKQVIKGLQGRLAKEKRRNTMKRY